MHPFINSTMMEACCSRFTAAEGGARLAAAAATKNILAVEYASFIPVRLLYEKAYQIRGSLFEGSKRSIYVTRASRVQVVAYELKILTDLGTVAAQAYEDVFDWHAELETKEVLICTSSVLKQILEEQLLSMCNINVLIVDSCHLIYSDDALKYIMYSYKQCPQSNQPIILALTYPLFNSTKKDSERDSEKETSREEEMGVYENVDDFDMYEKLEWKIEELESELCCEMDLAEDIDGGKRISSSVTKPRELIIEYGARPLDEDLPEVYKDLEKYMRDTVQDALDFIEDHRHDPTEIYGEELYDEFMNIPDPKLDPKQIFKQFLYILDQLGPYAADKAAFSLLTKLEKLKIKVPYERHFILMCLCTTVFIKIRCYADIIFSKYEDEWERIKTFSTSKIMRFAEILEKFKPPDIKNQNMTLSRLDSTISSQDSRDIKEDSGDNETGSVVSGCDSISRGDSKKKMLSDIDECDFRSLGNKIEDKVNTYCSNLREIFDSPTESFKDSTVNDKDSQNIDQANISSDTTSITSSNDTLNSNKPNIPSNSSISETDITDTANTTTKPDTDHKPDTSGINIQANDMETNTNKQLNEMNIQSDDISSTDIRVSGMDIKGNEIIVQRGLLGFPRRAGHRLRGRTRMQRNNAARVLQMQQNPDALCGIVFMKEALIAKIMFMMIVDMSRCNPRLGYLCVQYCATENPADPGTEPRECQRQGKKQEEVLKKFRMHECNLLLATSALEEGIDLPRCNLVLRWDVPVSYRSYGLCRGRARAARATAALLCSNNTDTTQMLLHNVATYRELDQIISRKCGCGIQDEPPQSEEDHADTFTPFIKPYSPNESANTNTSLNIPLTETQTSSNHDEKSIKTTKISEKRVISSRDIKESFISSKDIHENVISNKDIQDSVISSTDIQDSVKSSKDIEDVNNKDSEKSVKYNKNIEDSVISSKNSAISYQIHKKSIENSKDLIENVNFQVPSNTDLEKDSFKSKTLVIEDSLGNKKSEDAANTNICKGNGNSDNYSSKNINEDISNEVLIDNHNVIGGNNNKMIEEQSEVDCENGNITILGKAQRIFNDNMIGNANIDDIDTFNAENNDLINQIINKTANININDKTEDKLKQLNDIETNKNNEIDDQNNIEIINEQNMDKNCEQINENKNLTSNEAENDISRNDIHNIREFTIKNIPEDSSISKNDIGISKDNILSKVYCDKCYNVKVNNVCLCSNVNLYYQLLAKPNISENDIKKNISDGDSATVDLSTAIALINRYCGKLPSDTFTRLAPQWWMEEVSLPVAGSGETRTAYICTLRLPLNCPVKYNIVGHPMPTKVLARRMVALQACRILHMSGELDNQLMPIGKENFKAVELDACSVVAYNGASEPNDCARPGTTKRRQYYYKRTAWAFTDCQPIIDTNDEVIYPDADPETMDIDSDIEAPINESTKSSKPKEVVPQENVGQKRNMLYAIVSKLWCALPERYNTRGRRLHAPQNASQAIGILMSRDVTDNLQIPAFPVYTRSGEVRVSVEHIPDADVRMSPRRGRLVRRFMRFVFAEVLRVRRRGMKLHTSATTHNYNNYYIVPTVKVLKEDGTQKIDIDWAFLELIYHHTEDKKQTDIEKPLLWQDTEEEQKIERDSNKRRKGKKKMANPLLKKGECFVFDAEKYREAVVTPWYRNQDQPQFFLVAEICWNLSPDSSFPSATHQSFRDYYSTKYGVTLTQKEQPLLDVDHTSARLNLLTPRYVNRKGVALPVSSERTRRAKRDRLDQKQILIPELCRVHPFAAPLWFATVALPCVLYRINALLIADEIRRAVAIDVGLGIPKINEETMPGFQWPALDFGWSLAEVLSADSEKNEKKKEDDESKKEHKGKEIRNSEDTDEEIDGEQKVIEDEQVEVKEKTINDILQEKEAAEAEAAFEIGTWSNDMASCIPETSEYDELMEPLPPNLTFCTSSAGGTNWCDPIAKPKFSQFNPTKNFSMADSDDSYMSSDLDSDDSDLDYDGSDDDTDTSGFCSGRNTNAMGVRIEYKTAHEAEAFDLERTKKVNPAPMPDEEDDLKDKVEHDRVIRQGSAPEQHITKFREAVSQHKEEIIKKGHLITKEEHITEVLPETKDSFNNTTVNTRNENETLKELFPFGFEELTIKNGQIDIKSIEKNKRSILNQIKNILTEDEIKKLNCFSMKDINIDGQDYVNEKVVNVGFDTREGYEEVCRKEREFVPYYEEGKSGKEFDFDHQPVLEGHPGPSPSVILQALTMSNANDGINLERLETIGDSFLKFAITAYLYCAHPTVHEGKLSHMRSKQVSNLNLYRLGRNKRLGARMIASKFEPHDNWLPPCHKPPPTLHPRINGEGKDIMQHLDTPLDAAGCFIPYNLITQHSIPDKSIADCVEALIGAYLLECGPRGALLFMSWLGIRVLPCHHVALPDTHPYVRRMEKTEKENQEATPPSSPVRQRRNSSSSSCSDDESSTQEVFPEEDWSWPGRAVGSLQPYRDQQGNWMQPIFGALKAPPSPLLRYIEDPEGELEMMLSGYDALERTLQYRFKDRSLLLQALTHASHHSNRLTDCYQRLEFLGDAILDYLITRHLYEDPRRHSPGALTDLRSALVNNTIFATLAARHGFHKYFRHMSPGLNEVLTKYVKIQEENGHSISEEHYLIQEDEMEQAEDVEVPKALGDLFESVAGAIFLDSGMSLGAVWKSYVNLMGAELEAFSAAAPKSPVRELLEAEPDTAKFGKPERLADGRRVRVCVEVFGRGTFKGVGRNYRIAKGTAARCALRHLKVHRAR